MDSLADNARAFMYRLGTACKRTGKRAFRIFEGTMMLIGLLILSIVLIPLLIMDWVWGYANNKL